MGTPGQVLAVWGLGIIAAVFIGKRKGRLGGGILLGVLLGVIGAIVIACLPATHAVKVRREAERQRVREDAARQLRGQM